MSKTHWSHLLPLYLSALRVAVAAQQLRHVRVDEVIPRLLAADHLPRAVDSTLATRAASRASRLLGLLGQLDSCLVRSLVLGSLISDRPGVEIHFGFRPGEADTEGHAWVSLNGEVLGFSDDEQDNPRRYTIARSLPLQRPEPRHDRQGR